MLHKGPDRLSECRYWERTPGYWCCQVAGDEFCHFLEGEACYTHDNGESTEIREHRCVLSRGVGRRLSGDEDLKEGLHDSLTALAQCLGRLIAM